jgi:hypothetical protein
VTLPAPRSARLFAAGCALVFFLGHLPFPASTLEDVDSVNFALGLRRFDVAAHRPHPPGYPLLIAIGKTVRPVVAATLPRDAPADPIDARTLALIGIVFGALTAIPLLQVFRMIDSDEWRARAALVLAMCNPLMWFTASRPLSDVAGLFVGVTAQALLLTAWRRQRSLTTGGSAAGGARLADSGRLIVLGALIAGLAIGMRSQTAWLTVPVLVLVLGDRAGRGAAGALLGSSITFTIGVLLWAVPLLWVSGGLSAYVRAATGQASEDLTGIDMLARNPTVGRFLAGLQDTFVDPLDGWWLAAPMLVLALMGACAMVWRSRAAFTMLVVASMPYAAFHLTFHETFTTRYALPLMPVLAYLVVRGLGTAGRWAIAGGTLVLAFASLSVTVPALAAYSAGGSPVARAVEDVRDGLARHHPHGRALVMNHPFSIALRDETFDADVLPSVRREQWLEIVKYWQGGGSKPIWFLAEPGPNGLDRHHELTLIDPTSRHLRRSYRWAFDPTVFVGGARPSELDWFELTDPGWFATGGWALTPEIAGVSRLDRLGPAHGGVSAWVRRRREPAVIAVGGRNLGDAGGPAVRFDLAIDGRPVRTWRVHPRPGFFSDMWTLDPAQLSGDGPFATLVITATADDSSQRPVEASIEQFDIQPLSGVVSLFEDGWHEQEFAPATGRLWRWASERASVKVHGNGQPLRCLIRGESTRRYFDRPSRLTLLAGERVLAELQPSADYTWEVQIPADALAASGGIVTLTTDQTFVPDERTGNGDRRRLGLRVYEFRVDPAAVATGGRD